MTRRWNAESVVKPDGFAAVRIAVAGFHAATLDIQETQQLILELTKAWCSARDHNQRVLGPEGRLPEGPGHAAR